MAPTAKKPVPVAAKPVEPVKTPEPVKKDAAVVKKPVPAKVVEKAVEETETAEVVQSPLDRLEGKINGIVSLVKETVAELRVLKKEYDRLKKTVEKTERKRANARSNPNGFAKPVPITDELCTFLSLPKGSELSRTDITRQINAYIRQHNLNKPENKRFIIPDDKLRKLFHLAAGEEISYFSIQKHITKVIIKPTPSA